MSASKSKISIEKQLHYAEKGEQGGVDIREPSTAILGISSVDRYAKPGASALALSQSEPFSTITLQSPYDFQLQQTAQNLITGFFTRLAVNEVQFRWTLPTLTSRNNKIYIYVDPNNNGTITNVASVSGGAVTFTFASTTGFVAGQDVVIYNVATTITGTIASTFNGVYRIASVTGTTIVCNNPNGLATLTTTSASGQAVIRALATLPEGWYDIYNQDTSSTSRAGNMGYTFAVAITGAVSGTYTMSSGTLLTSFNCLYLPNWQGGTNPGTTIPISGQVYNTWFATNLASSGVSKFFFGRFTDLNRPNAVSLMEMMAWGTNQNLLSNQYSSPNASMLSTPFVDIVCDGMTYNQSLKDGDSGDISRSMLCRVFLTPDAFTGNVANLGSAPILVHRVFPFPKQIKWNANQPIGNLRFQVFDSQGYLLTTNDGLQGNPTNSAFYDADMGDWTLTLLVSEV
jgi:hypothetical protein